MTPDGAVYYERVIRLADMEDAENSFPVQCGDDARGDGYGWMYQSLSALFWMPALLFSRPLP